MTSHRVERVSALIKQELNIIIRREIEIPLGSLLTINRVETSPDLEHARVWVSIFPAQYKDSILVSLNRNIGFLQKLLNRKLVMHWVPKINFRIDESQDRAEHINKLIDQTTPPDKNNEERTE